jgi:hypothetical protein
MNMAGSLKGSDTGHEADAFRFIKPEELEALGIDPADIPLGTLPALKHPAQLPSRFGGNAYGFGLFELGDRLTQNEVTFLQEIQSGDAFDIGRNAKKLNDIFQELGLLTRFSNRGRPYYLIPIHLVSNTLLHVKTRVEEISKVIDFHRRKYFKEQHDIGILSPTDDLITHELSVRFKEHRFFVIDSLEKLKELTQVLDLVIVTRDLHEMILLEKFSVLSPKTLAKMQLDQYATYVLWKIYGLLKPEGELFIIANHYRPKTSEISRVTFHTAEEENRFTLFTHLFKTKSKYRIKDHAVQVNLFDFHQYLSGLYVEEGLVRQLLGGRRLEDMTIEEVDQLPFISFQLHDHPYLSHQEKTWSKLLPTFFDTIFLKPIVPDVIKEDRAKRFSCAGCSPACLMVYLGQKKPSRDHLGELSLEVTESRLAGCPVGLLADYRNSFEYLVLTLQIVQGLKSRKPSGLPHVLLDRLREPLESKKRRFPALNTVMRLAQKIHHLERISPCLNPGNIEGGRTKILENLAALEFFGYTHEELKELFLIVLGHSSMGRVISGKMSEKTLKPLTDFARTLDPIQGLNLLRYCRLMTMAEMEASRGSELTQEQLAELFDLYESTARIMSNPNLDWDKLLDDRITVMGGIHYKAVRKILKMIHYHEFLNNWSDLSQKGSMEKEALADYEEGKLSRLANVISLVEILDQFENKYLKSNLILLPVFYRKILDLEFHGTGHLFQKMDPRLVFIHLWITVNVVRGEIINFNPLLTRVESAHEEDWIRKLEKETRAINTRYLDPEFLSQFSRQVYEGGSSFIVGTGFQARLNPKTQALEVAYVDMDKQIRRLESLSRKLGDLGVTDMPEGQLRDLETLFSDVDSFYHSHVGLVSQTDPALHLPVRQKRWFEKIQALREYLRTNFLRIIFRPEEVHSNLSLLYHHAPSLLKFIIPEFMALGEVPLTRYLYLKTNLPEYVLATTKKLQALVTGQHDAFRDVHYLHQLATREFGPLATGIVGVSESQIEILEEIVSRLRQNGGLFDALIATFVFQEIVHLTGLRGTQRGRINPVDISKTRRLIFEAKGIAEKYHLRQETHPYLAFLLKYQSLLLQILRGEVSYCALNEVLMGSNEETFDAFFLLSFINVSALREELILEDQAETLLQLRSLCHRILRGVTTFQDHLEAIYVFRGGLHRALEMFRRKKVPKDISPFEYLESQAPTGHDRPQWIEAGQKIFALERLLRLKGLRRIGFSDIASVMLEIPLKYVYKKRKFSSTGYASFEKEVFEALRVYHTLEALEEPVRHFVLECLVGDTVRISGYEKVGAYLSYENLIKLLLIGLLGLERVKHEGGPVYLSYLRMSEKIDKRYEVVNDHLNQWTAQCIWESPALMDQMFEAGSGLALQVNGAPNALSIEFHDPADVTEKIRHMEGIRHPEQLKTYFHFSLHSLRKSHFFTEDYEIELEKAFERRLLEITEMILDQTRTQMDLIQDFPNLHHLFTDLIERAWEIGFSEEQQHRLGDLYELRKDRLKREKILEIDGMLKNIRELSELRDYWGSIKWYLQANRPYFGKEFENLIARKFDALMRDLETRNGLRP